MSKSKTFKKALEDALKKEGVKNEWMEKHLLIDSLDLDKPIGVLITAIHKQGPAKISGLRVGDVIIRFLIGTED